MSQGGGGQRAKDREPVVDQSRSDDPDRILAAGKAEQLERVTLPPNESPYPYDEPLDVLAVPHPKVVWTPMQAALHSNR